MLIINSVIPTFIIIAIGFALKQKKVLEPCTETFLNNLAYYLILPVMIFDSIYKVPFKEIFEIKVILGLYMVSVIVFVLCVLIAMKLPKEKKGAFVNGALRSNIAYIGFPIAYTLYGTHGLARLSVVTGFVAPVLIGLAITYLNIVHKDNSKKQGLAEVLIKDPLIMTCIAALITSYYGVKIPVVFSNTISMLAMMGSPLMLLAVGAGLNIAIIRRDRVLLGMASFIKLLLFPALSFLVFTYLLKITDKEILGVAVLTFSFPTALSSYVLVKKYGSDHQFSAAAITVTTALSLFTISMWIYIISAVQ